MVCRRPLAVVVATVGIALAVAAGVMLETRIRVMGDGEPAARAPDASAIGEAQAIQIALNELAYASPGASPEHIVARRMPLDEYFTLGRSVGPAVNPDIQQTEVWVVAFRTAAPLERTAFTDGDWGDDAAMQEFMDDPGRGGAWFQGLR